MSKMVPTGIEKDHTLEDPNTANGRNLPVDTVTRVALVLMVVFPVLFLAAVFYSRSQNRNGGFWTHWLQQKWHPNDATSIMVLCLIAD
jgi:hypothetical protein